MATYLIGYDDYGAARSLDVEYFPQDFSKIPYRNRKNKSRVNARESSSERHAAGEKIPKHNTHVLQALKVPAGAVNLNAGEILYRPVFGHKFVSKNEAMQDFVASCLFRLSAATEVLHTRAICHLELPSAAAELHIHGCSTDL